VGAASPALTETPQPVRVGGLSRSALMARLARASVPPPDTLDQPWGFYLRRVDGVPWLRGYRCWSGHVWAPEDVLVFTQACSAEPMQASPSRP
jgi:hypothetical protein